jgi:putative membrane protein
MLMRAIQLLGVIPIGSVCLYRAVTLYLNARSWQLLLPPAGRPPFVTLLRLRWIGESINNLLPAAQVGGDLARASLVSSHGVPRADATVAMAADFVTGLVTQIVFAAAGAFALARFVRPEIGGLRTWAELIAGLAVVTIAVVAASFIFHVGAARAAARHITDSKIHEGWGRLAGGIDRFNRAGRALLARRRALAAAFGWHLAGWFSQVGETWLLLGLFGVPVSLDVAFTLESLTAAARGAAFFVPSGVGVQEVTILSMARLLGVEMEPAVALGIAKRAREVATGVPGLLAWLLAQKGRLRGRKDHD